MFCTCQQYRKGQGQTCTPFVRPFHGRISEDFALQVKAGQNQAQWEVSIHQLTSAMCK